MKLQVSVRFFLTSREFSALYLASSVFSTTNNIRKFEVNVEDNGDFIKVTFLKVMYHLRF